MPDDALLNGEVVLFASRRHWLTLWVPVAAALLAGSLLAGSCADFALENSGSSCALFVALTVALSTTPFVLEWLMTWFVLTHERLVFFQSPIWLRTHSLWLNEVASISTHQGILGRLFGFGELTVHTAAPQGGRLILSYTPDPLGAQERIVAAVTARQLG